MDFSKVFVRHQIAKDYFQKTKENWNLSKNLKFDFRRGKYIYQVEN